MKDAEGQQDLYLKVQWQAEEMKYKIKVFEEQQLELKKYLWDYNMINTARKVGVKYGSKMLNDS